jgi:hypothetical protein
MVVKRLVTRVHRIPIWRIAAEHDTERTAKRAWLATGMLKVDVTDHTVKQHQNGDVDNLWITQDFEFLIRQFSDRRGT